MMEILSRRKGILIETDYKVLIEVYCEEKGYTAEQSRLILKPCVYEKDLFNLSFMALGDLAMDMVGFEPGTPKRRTEAYFKLIYSYLVNLFDWFAEKAYMPFNPYREFESLSLDTLLYDLQEQNYIVVVYEEDISSYVNKAEYNKEMYEIIFRLLYDGVASNKELASIKNADIESYVLTLPDREVVLSPETVEVIDRYNRVDTFYIAKAHGVETHSYERHKDFLFKKTSKHYKSDVEDAKYIKSNANAIGNYLKKLNITYIDIVRSGMVDKLRKEFDMLSDIEFCDLFIQHKKLNTGEARKIKKVIAIYGKSRTNTEMDNCLSYIIKSKYYRV